MNSPSPRFPEYGDSGDFIGARRFRRAFRWGVALLVFFTLLLWVTEQFWRYSPADRLYRSALTLLPEQGRNLLRQSVKYDAPSASPSSKYYEALAEREEDDLVVAAYENASAIDPQNADLAIKYGCQLYKLGMAPRARAQFRRAAEGGAHNALAVYLEAAVLPLLGPEDPDLDLALSLVQQANNAGDIVRIPRPMWFSSLPATGHWYAQLRRQMAQLCGAPLERFAEYVVGASEKDLAEKKGANSIENLQVLEAMGRRIALSAIEPEMAEGDLAGGDPQLNLGIHIMLLAIEQQQRVAQVTGGPPDERLAALAAKLGPALRTIESFEKNRHEMIEAERIKYGFPWTLIETALAVTFLGFLAAYALSKVLGAQAPAHSLPHASVSRIAWGVYFGMALGLLLLVSVMQRASHGDLPAAGSIAVLWNLMLMAVLVAGVAIPAFSLSSPVDTLQRLPAERRCELTVVRKRYRAAYASLVKRHLGVQLGLTLCTLCIWIISYRVITGTYPWMMPLLITGMEQEEIAMMRGIAAMLG